MPLDGTHIGLTLWFGSVNEGWRGWPVFKRGLVYSLRGVPTLDERPSDEEMLRPL